MRPLHVSIFCLLVLTSLTVAANPAAAITTKYTESFTSKQYCDQVNTTALWDTVAGELKLPPFHLTLAGSYDTPECAVGVAVSGDYAFVADDYAVGGSGLQVIDISDPTNPTLAGSYDTPGNAYDVAIAGRYAYIADNNMGLTVVDINDPTNPTLAGNYDTPSWAYGVAISGDHAYVADGYDGLQVIDISDPTNPTLAGSYDMPGTHANGVAISGDYVFVSHALGLLVLDISNPASPAFVGSYSSYDNYRHIVIDGKYAYIALKEGATGLRVLDISDPSNPTFVSDFRTSDQAFRVAISGDYAYLANGYDGLMAIDISDPANPVLAGSYDTPGNAWGVAISGDYAYVADATSGLQVIEAFQRRYDIQSNVGRSVVVDDSDNTILKARLASTQTDSIRWEMSANGGVSWMGVSPNKDWQTVDVAGTDLVWRSTHYYAGGGVNPTCSDLTIEWLYEFPSVDRIVDIPNDQGRQVRVHITRSGADFGDASPPVATYNVWRRVDEPNLLPSPRYLPLSERALVPSEALTEHVGDLPIQVLGDRRFLFNEGGQISASFPPGTWEIVGSFAACQMDQYIYATTTLADSTEAGIPYAVFCISAHTTIPSVWYVSPTDSGYSVDNLAPAPPTNLKMTSPTTLTWDESKDKDFKYFTVYGSAVPGLDSTGTLIGYTIGTAMDITGDVYKYYHVTASDFSGNEGNASTVSNAYAGVTTDASIPTAFALRENRPNPFSSRTSVAFDLPMACTVSLKVFDAQGRQVRALVDQAYPAGRHSAVWAGDDEAGNAVGSGIYFVRIEAGDFRATSKMLLTR